MEGSGERPKRRAQRNDVLMAKSAISAVRPVRDKMGEWQAATARLRARLLHDQQAEHADVAAAANRLILDVERARRELELQAGALPALVRGDGHFQDALRALSALITSIEAIAPPQTGKRRRLPPHP